MPVWIWKYVFKNCLLKWTKSPLPTYRAIVNKAKIILSKHNIQMNYQTDHRCENSNRIPKVEKMLPKINTNISPLLRFEEQMQCVISGVIMPWFSLKYTVWGKFRRNVQSISIIHLKFKIILHRHSEIFQWHLIHISKFPKKIKSIVLSIVFRYLILM